MPFYLILWCSLWLCC